MPLKTPHLLLGLLLFTVSCVDINALEDAEAPPYRAEFALPLVNSSIGIREILEEAPDAEALRIDAEGQIFLEYRGAVLGRDGAEVFEQVATAFPPVIPISSNNLALPFAVPNGIDLDRLDLKQGILSYYLENPNEEPVEVEVNFPTFLKDGVPLSFNLTLPAYSGSGPFPGATNQTDPFDISGYAIIPQNDSVYVNYSATTPSGAEVSLVNFIVRMQDLGFSYAEGYLGQLLFEGGDDVIPIDFFDTYTGGDIYFAAPVVTFDVENSFGVPTRAVVNQFDVTTVDGEVLTVESNLIDNGIDFPFPDLQEVGQSRTERYVFNKQNSNVDELLGAGPVEVAYDIDARINPENNSSIKGFMTDSSFFRVQMLVDLPLFGSASGFTTNDTIGLDLDSYSEVTAAEFKVVTENGTGIDLFLQGYFLDESGTVLDSLLSGPQQIVVGAPVDDQGRVTGARSQTTFIALDATQFDRIRTSEELLLQVRFSTETNDPRYVRLLDSDRLQVRIGAILEINAND